MKLLDVPLPSQMAAPLQVASSTVASGEKRMVALDGVRAVACLMVVIHHVYFHAGEWGGALGSYASLGYFGVECFFLVSGFCMGLPFFASPDYPRSFGDYYRRRFNRIIPPYWIAFIFLAFTFSTPPDSFKHWFYGLSLFGTSVNASFWTLCVELRWYVAFPFTLMLLRRWGFGPLFILSCAMCGAYKYLAEWAGDSGMPGKLLAIAGGLPLFFPLFLLGIKAAELYATRSGEKRRRLSIPASCGLVLFAGLIIAFAPRPIPVGDFFPYLRLFLGAGLGFCLILAGLTNRYLRAVLGNPAMALVGLASYSIYLVHEPIIHYLYNSSAFWRTDQMFLKWQVFVFPSLVAAGLLFHFLAEKPAIMLSRWIFKRFERS